MNFFLSNEMSLVDIHITHYHYLRKISKQFTVILNTRTSTCSIILNVKKEGNPSTNARKGYTFC